MDWPLNELDMDAGQAYNEVNGRLDKKNELGQDLGFVMEISVDFI